KATSGRSRWIRLPGPTGGRPYRSRPDKASASPSRASITSRAHRTRLGSTESPTRRNDATPQASPPRLYLRGTDGGDHYHRHPHHDGDPDLQQHHSAL